MDYLAAGENAGDLLREARFRENVMQYLSLEELSEILSLTIKRDTNNKILIFLCMLTAFTKSSQLNISFNSPSSTGKTFLPVEIGSLFPSENARSFGHCSPTSFFHDALPIEGMKNVYKKTLRNMILIFLDQPDNQLLERLRPILSHDQKEIMVKITDKTKNGNQVKKIIIEGFPVVIFCSAGLRPDEQEATRFLLLSPEMTQEKICEAIQEKLCKERDEKAYLTALENNPKRRALKERIVAIKEAKIEEIRIENTEEIEKTFLSKKTLKPRYTRDVSRVISLIKALALLNFWHRRREGGVIIAADEDIKQGLKLWEGISQSQELNLPKYVYDLFVEVILPLLKDSEHGITRQLIMKRYCQVYERSLPDWQLRREILPLLENAGLILQESDPTDKRRMIILLPEQYDESRFKGPNISFDGLK